LNKNYTADTYAYSNICFFRNLYLFGGLGNRTTETRHHKYECCITVKKGTNQFQKSHVDPISSIQ